MENTRIRTKIGDNEFEMEGPPELVTAQFQSFLERIGSAPAASIDSSAIPKHPSDSIQSDTGNNLKQYIAKIMHVSGRIVSLTALPQSNEDAALLIMLGHKELRNNDAVTGQEIGDGLAQSGRPVVRVDRVMDTALTEAMALKSGIRRSTRYRLSNQGMVKALTLAKALSESLP
jgi:hypothetical protein